MDNLITFVRFLHNQSRKETKSSLELLSQQTFNLTRDSRVYYCDSFAVRFSSSKNKSFSNTVLGLSILQKYDEKPFIVCLVTPLENVVYLSNSTFLKRISHSSHELRVNNIKGSFNGSDIYKDFNGIINRLENFEELFNIHKEIGFEINLCRLVEATTGIKSIKSKFEFSEIEQTQILSSPAASISFINSNDYIVLKQELDEQVKKYKNEILIASHIPNVNLRGKIIEYLIAGNDNTLRNKLIDQIKTQAKEALSFKTKNSLYDYERIFADYSTGTDVKTKVMYLNSSPKGYNIDKLLEFLSISDRVFLVYFVGVDFKQIQQSLISIFQKDLLSTTKIIKHWAGRNSRGVTQFNGEIIKTLILSPNNLIDITHSKKYLNDLIGLT